MIVLSRRALLKACATPLITGGALPAVSFGAPPPAAASILSDNFLWQNKHLNVTQRAWRYYDVWNRGVWAEPWRTGFSALRDIVNESQANGRAVRAVGGRWSLSDSAVSPDVMINTMPLNVHRAGMAREFIASSRYDRDHLVFAQCGTSILELSSTLESRGLALPTSGASNGQTICGAFSTGTHGSARRVGSSQDYIVGLHIIADGGKHYWIERASDPVVSDGFCQYLGAELRRDDNLFNAAVVSFGSFGIIHAVLLAAVPIYRLEVHRWFADWPAVEHAASTLDLTGLTMPRPEEPFHFEVTVNPYRARTGQNGAFVTAMYRVDTTTSTERPSPEMELLPGADVLTIAGSLSDTIPGLIPGLVTGLFKETCVPTGNNPIVGTHGEIFDATKIKGKSLSAEIGVSLDDVRRAVEALIQVADKYHFAGVIALRYVRRSAALLAFTKFDTTCTIELPAAGSHRTLEYYERVWDEFDSRGIPYTLHWGQSNNHCRESVRKRWGSAAEQWLTTRRAFLTPTGRRTFANPLLERCDLAT